MIPDLDLQLQVVIKALRDTVSAAVDPLHQTAVEQLGLSIATLTMVRERLPFASAREWQDLSDAIDLAQCIGDAATSEELPSAIAAGRAALCAVNPAPGLLVETRQTLLALVSEHVNMAPDEVALPLMRAVVDASKPATDLARAWSKPAGFEPDPGEVPELATLLSRTKPAKVS